VDCPTLTKHHQVGRHFNYCITQSAVSGTQVHCSIVALYYHYITWLLRTITTICWLEHNTVSVYSVTISFNVRQPSGNWYWVKQLTRQSCLYIAYRPTAVSSFIASPRLYSYKVFDTATLVAHGRDSKPNAQSTGLTIGCTRFDSCGQSSKHSEITKPVICSSSVNNENFKPCSTRVNELRLSISIKLHWSNYGA